MMKMKSFHITQVMSFLENLPHFLLKIDEDECGGFSVGNDSYDLFSMFSSETDTYMADEMQDVHQKKNDSLVPLNSDKVSKEMVDATMILETADILARAYSNENMNAHLLNTYPEGIKLCELDTDSVNNPEVTSSGISKQEGGLPSTTALLKRHDGVTMPREMAGDATRTITDDVKGWPPDLSDDVILPSPLLDVAGTSLDLIHLPPPFDVALFSRSYDVTNAPSPDDVSGVFTQHEVGCPLMPEYSAPTLHDDAILNLENHADMERLILDLEDITDRSLDPGMMVDFLPQESLTADEPPDPGPFIHHIPDSMPIQEKDTVHCENLVTRTASDVLVSAELETERKYPCVEGQYSSVRSQTADDRFVTMDIEPIGVNFGSPDIGVPLEPIKYVSATKLVWKEYDLSLAKRPRECRLCPLVFRSCQDYLQHLHTAHGVNKTPRSNTTCHLCGQVLRYKHLQAHIEAVHNQEKPHTCLLCNKAFKQKHYLKLHMEKHKPKRERRCYQCSHCGKKFSQKGSLNDHRYKYKNQGLFCKVCREEFPCRTAAQKHAIIHRVHAHTCPVCGRQFNTEQRLKVHQSSHDKPGHRCPKCGKEFANRVLLDGHSKMCSLGLGRNLRLVQFTDFICDCCGERFETMQETKNHIQELHVISGKKVQFMATMTPE